MEITARTQKSLTVNTVHSAIYKCRLKLYHANRGHKWIWSRSATVIPGPKHIWNWLKQSGKRLCVQPNLNCKFYFEITNVTSSGLKRRVTIQLVISSQILASLMEMGMHSCLWKWQLVVLEMLCWDLHTSLRAIFEVEVVDSDEKSLPTRLFWVFSDILLVMLDTSFYVTLNILFFTWLMQQAGSKLLLYLDMNYTMFLHWNIIISLIWVVTK